MFNLKNVDFLLHTFCNRTGNSFEIKACLKTGWYKQILELIWYERLFFFFFANLLIHTFGSLVNIFFIHINNLLMELSVL